jgi:hypothetical protein
VGAPCIFLVKRLKQKGKSRSQDQLLFENGIAYKKNKDFRISHYRAFKVIYKIN